MTHVLTYQKAKREGPSKTSEAICGSKPSANENQHVHLCETGQTSEAMTATEGCHYGSPFEMEQKVHVPEWSLGAE